MSTKFVLIVLAATVCGSLAAVLPNQDTSTESDEFDQYLQAVFGLQGQCSQMTGSDETFEQLVLGISVFPLCVLEHVDLTALTEDIENLTESNRVSFFGKYCPQLNNSFSCLNPITDMLRRCWDEEDRAILDIIINILPEALNLVCKDNGDLFYKLEDPDYEQCMEKFGDYAVECGSKVSNTTEVLNLGKLGEVQCRELSDVRSCIVDKLDTCKLTGIMGLFDLFYRPLVKASPCKKYISLDNNDIIESNAV